MRYFGHAVIGVLLVLLSANSLSAQTLVPERVPLAFQPPTVLADTASELGRRPLIIGSSLGSTLGAAVGVVSFGHGFDGTGSDFGGILGAMLVGAAIGGTLGSAAGARLIGEARFLPALRASALGIVPGFALAALTQFAGPGPAFLGFGVGQGITTGLVLTW